jgi:hypothetical protein
VRFCVGSEWNTTAEPLRILQTVRETTIASAFRETVVRFASSSEWFGVPRVRSRRAFSGLGLVELSWPTNSVRLHCSQSHTVAARALSETYMRVYAPRRGRSVEKATSADEYRETCERTSDRDRKQNQEAHPRCDAQQEIHVLIAIPNANSSQ